MSPPSRYNVLSESFVLDFAEETPKGYKKKIHQITFIVRWILKKHIN